VSRGDLFEPITCRFCGSKKTRWTASEAQVCDDCKRYDVHPGRANDASAVKS
jgi:ribosome-binding protein aMBF1 (putative translation factor)